MPQQINLYNPAFQEQRALLSFNGAVTGWVVVVALVAAVAAYQSISMQNAQSRERVLAQQVAALQADAQRLGSELAARKGDPKITEEVGRLEAEVKGRQEVMEVLHAGGIGNTRGFSEHLKAFARQSFDGVWLTGLSIASAGRDVTIEGRASQAGFVPGYLKRLNGEPAMQGHPFSELLIQEPAPDPVVKNAARPNYVEFKLTTKPVATEQSKAGAR